MIETPKQRHEVREVSPTHLESLRKHILTAEKHEAEIEGEMPRENIMRYGWKFISTFPEVHIPGAKRTRYVTRMAPSEFESPVAASLIIEDASKPSEHFAGGPKMKPFPIAQAKLSFEPGAVRVMAIQGIKTKEGPDMETTNAQSYLDRFAQPKHGGVRWHKHLLSMIEEHARKHGFDRVMLIQPHNLYFYRLEYMEDEEEAKRRPIRARINSLYENIAEENGYALDPAHPGYYVKKLR